MNNSEPEGETDGHRKRENDLKDGDSGSAEEKHGFKKVLRRSKRQVSVLDVFVHDDS